MRALREGSLYAVRDNLNRWKIDQDDLDKWTAERPPVSDQTVTSGHTRPDIDTVARLATAETRAEMLAAQLADTIEDRNAWREQAERLASHAERRHVSIIDRIFGRG